MRVIVWAKKVLIFSMLASISHVCLADEDQYNHARELQREGRFDEAIAAYRNYLSQPVDEDRFTEKDVTLYTDALVQLMNVFQSKGEPQACIKTLQDVYKSSPILQDECLRDFYSVLGYALSRTEEMKEAEETMLKAFTLPLHHATPERYFRDYAYAAAVFYSNPSYHKEVICWCEEALGQARLCKNTSGLQWVTAMLGSLYKKDGDFNKSLQLFLQSKEEAQEMNDDLGVLNSLNTLIDLFLYWNIPEYANLYASEAIAVEKATTMKNPMVSAQAYINKGRALHQLGVTDSIPFYTERARMFCESLPYNSGMVDVDLLHGTYLTEKGGDSLESGLRDLQQVTQYGTVANRVKAYHQLAQTYLKYGNEHMAGPMLDSLYVLISMNDSPNYLLHIDYKPILEYYRKFKRQDMAEKYVMLMLQDQQTFRQKLNYNLVEAVVDLQAGRRLQDMKIIQLRQANQRLWLLMGIALCLIIITAVVALLFHQRKIYVSQINQADEKLAALVQKLNQSNVEKEMVSQEIKEFLKDKENYQELQTLTPFILKESGESKFRQCFDLLHPLFLHRLRENVPSVTRREELLSMLILLKQDNKQIAELLAIAPRSVLMLRHRFRQKIGMTTEYSLENFIESLSDQK